MIGEALTKIVIAATGIVFATTGILNPVVAFLFVSATLVLSFQWDRYVRSHGSYLQLTGKPRMLPTFGTIWLMSMFMLHPLVFLIQSASGSLFLSPAHVTLTCCVVVFFVRVICIVIERSVNWGFEKVVDPLIDHLHGVPPEPKYRTFVPPAYWGYRCPVCGARVQYAIDVCWHCKYGADNYHATANQGHP